MQSVRNDSLNMLGATLFMGACAGVLAEARWFYIALAFAVMGTFLFLWALSAHLIWADAQRRSQHDER